MTSYLVPLRWGLVAAILLIGGAGVDRAGDAPIPAGPPIPTTFPRVVEIQVSSNIFTPNSVMIRPGDTVRWVWVGGNHTTTSNDGLWDSGVRGVGSQFEVTFDEEGEYDYFCSLHLACCNQVGTILVVPQ